MGIKKFTPMNVLGIETACDDTSVSIVVDGKKILSNVIWTQRTAHQKFGGVVPEIAARSHTKVITYVIQEALDKANLTFKDLDLVGVNCKHGLLRSIIVGVSAAKAIAYSHDIPIVGVHHIEGHIYSNIINNPEIEFPHICLTVSGGHNLLIHVLDHGSYELIGKTLDDAAGEAFDKVAKLLNLGFPGGPIIDQLSKTGDADAFNFPRPMLHQPNFDFSFSGLKTAVRVSINKLKQENKEIVAADIAASFQKAVVEILVKKTMKAAKEKKVNTITLAGGVSANSMLRKLFMKEGEENSIRILYPDISLCTDNGAMVAALAYYNFKRGLVSDLSIDAKANAPLGDLNVVYKVKT